MTDATAETQACPFCYTEMDARADVCPSCQATKDTTPEWAKRFDIYKTGAIAVIVGLGLMFIDGKGIWWWGSPFVLIGCFFLFRAHKFDVSEVLWHRKE